MKQAGIMQHPSYLAKYGAPASLLGATAYRRQSVNAAILRGLSDVPTASRRHTVISSLCGKRENTLRRLLPAGRKGLHMRDPYLMNGDIAAPAAPQSWSTTFQNALKDSVPKVMTTVIDSFAPHGTSYTPGPGSPPPSPTFMQTYGKKIAIGGGLGLAALVLLGASRRRK